MKRIIVQEAVKVLQPEAMLLLPVSAADVNWTLIGKHLDDQTQARIRASIYGALVEFDMQKHPARKRKREENEKRVAIKITESLNAMTLADVEALQKLDDQQRRRLRAVYLLTVDATRGSVMNSDVLAASSDAMTTQEWFDFYVAVVHAWTPVVRSYCSQVLPAQVRERLLEQCEQQCKQASRGWEVCDFLRPRPELKPFLISLKLINNSICAIIVSYC